MNVDKGGMLPLRPRRKQRRGGLAQLLPELFLEGIPAGKRRASAPAIHSVGGHALRALRE
ncbi:MAG: hypothetical protein C4520_21980 [Candidatus Abyssobacteria bacterium SURF_5]|uniref:Uncharacterized protein n=1 Tax=Abyssobacteria bacterium (strain SURF_5) TaxID=2093360 RepID=A0A3A4NGB9_ABYX5|nr:MAG: hypothetical protein C4520_21980 [Candidatus Abyssubacteria bacterium SURF_5]